MRRVLIVVVALLLGTGLWFGGSRFISRALAIRDIDRHEERWERMRPSDYRYRVEAVCMCGSGQLAFDVTVRNGRIAVIEPEPEGYEHAESIEELFDIARHAIHDGDDEVDIEYARDGHITRLFIDQLDVSVDDEVTYLVTDLRPLPLEP